MSGQYPLPHVTGDAQPERGRERQGARAERGAVSTL